MQKKFSSFGSSIKRDCEGKFCEVKASQAPEESKVNKI